MLSHLKTHVTRGLMALIPLGLCFFALRLIYRLIKNTVLSPLGTHTSIDNPIIGILLVLIILYVLGLMTRNVLGKSVLNLIEKVTSQIPIIKTTYQIGKQMVDTLVYSERKMFKETVLVEAFRKGNWMVGFHTGDIVPNTEQSPALAKVFVPTSPNPTTGFLILIPVSELVYPGWSPEEAMRSIISCGIIGPKHVSLTKGSGK